VKEGTQQQLIDICLVGVEKGSRTLFDAPRFAGPVVYVDADSSCVEKCGETWATAFADLGKAVEHAIAIKGDEIWVAEGTCQGPIRLESGLRIIGGFAGTEVDLSMVRKGGLFDEGPLVPIGPGIPSGPPFVPPLAPHPLPPPR